MSFKRTSLWTQMEYRVTILLNKNVMIHKKYMKSSYAKKL